MLQKPRTLSFSFFNLKELTTSIIQGLVITAGTLAVYQYAVSMNWNEEITRTMVFTVLVVANIFLTLVNRSFYFSVFTTIRYKNTLVYIILALTILMLCLLLYMPMVTSFFKFQQITPYQVGIGISVGFLSVIWFECIKLFKRVRKVSVNV
jgi:Ca2+-transporting ATPase